MNIDDIVAEHLAGSPWKKGVIIYVDVDDTLIDHNDIPKRHVCAWLKRLHSEGATLYLWSQGGGEYAREMATKNGLEWMFVGFLPKPDICVDDLEITAKFILKHIHPIQLI